MNVKERYRRWRRYRTMIGELGAYPPHELSELGIARADIEQTAFDAVYGAPTAPPRTPEHVLAR